MPGPDDSIDSDTGSDGKVNGALVDDDDTVDFGLVFQEFLFADGFE